MATFRQGPRPDEKYTMVSNALARNTDIPIEAKGIYLFMRSHVDGWVMSVERIAKALGISKTRTSKYINVLIDSRYIIRTQDQGDSGKFGEVEYTILSEPHPINEDTVGPHPQNTANGETGERISGLHKKTIPKKITQEREDHSSSVDEPKLATAFKEFWDHYPRKIARIKAEEKFKEKAEEVGADVLINAVKNYATECIRYETEKKFIPYPATWIYQNRWKDSLTVSKTSVKKSEPAPEFDMGEIVSLIESGEHHV